MKNFVPSILLLASMLALSSTSFAQELSARQIQGKTADGVPSAPVSSVQSMWIALPSSGQIHLPTRPTPLGPEGAKATTAFAVQAHYRERDIVVQGGSVLITVLINQGAGTEKHLLSNDGAPAPAFGSPDAAASLVLRVSIPCARSLAPVADMGNALIIGAAEFEQPWAEGKVMHDVTKAARLGSTPAGRLIESGVVGVAVGRCR